MGKRYSRRFARSALVDEEPTPTYFVPTFSIRRNVTLDDKVSLEMQRKLKRALGAHFNVRPPSGLGLTVVNQRKFIERLREARVEPEASEIRKLALSTRDSMAEILKDKPAKLKIPLKDTVAVFGSKDNQLGLELRGWKGYSARYALEDETGEPLPLATIVLENKLAIGSISAAMARHRTFVVDGLARSPYVTLAKHRGGNIRHHELRAINERVQDILPAELRLEDPVIYLREYRDSPVELIYVRTPQVGLVGEETA